MLLKRRVLIGNIAVALMVALVPVYVLLFYRADIHILEGLQREHTDYYVFMIVMGFASCAFFINLLREITKDLADILGDKKIDANTYPIKYGVPSTKILISILAAAYISFLFFLYSELNELLLNRFDHQLAFNKYLNVVYFVLVVFVANFMFAVILTIFSKSTKLYKLSSNFYKLAMLAGVSLIFFL